MTLNIHTQRSLTTLSSSHLLLCYLCGRRVVGCSGWLVCIVLYRLDECVGWTEQLEKSVHQHLIAKYNIHFNFALSTPTNQILYNRTLSPSTIQFKDALIFADCNEYLKRYYFLKNAMDKDEIFDRIQLLSQFYGSAVLLRYEYPMMVLTRTKSVFLKRLKRLKNTLVEQGSSDDSKSNNDYKIVSINSSKFLKSLSSSELQRKSLDQSNKLELDFSLFDQDLEVHNIFEQEQGSKQIKLHSLLGSSADKLRKGMTYELVLQKEQKQRELDNLVTDFDEFDQEEVMRRYKQMTQNEPKTVKSNKKLLLHKDSINSAQNMQNNRFQSFTDVLGKKPMTSSVTITGFEDHKRSPHYNLNPNLEGFKKKSLMSPSSPRASQFPDRNYPSYNPTGMKTSSYYHLDLEHDRFNKYKEQPIAEDEREHSPKQLASYRKMNRGGEEWGFMSSRQPNPRERLDWNHKQAPSHVPITKYSSIISSTQLKSQSKPFSSWQTDQKDKFSNFKSKPYYKEPYNGYQRDKYGTQGQTNNRMTSINININNLEKQKEQVNVKVNKFGEEFEEEEKNYRAEKKKKIREKAAALLNRVKSQEYIRPLENYEQPQFLHHSRPYFDKYYN